MNGTIISYCDDQASDSYSTYTEGFTANGLDAGEDKVTRPLLIVVCLPHPDSYARNRVL